MLYTIGVMLQIPISHTLIVDGNPMTSNMSVISTAEEQSYAYIDADWLPRLYLDIPNLIFTYYHATIEALE